MSVRRYITEDFANLTGFINEESYAACKSERAQHAVLFRYFFLVVREEREVKLVILPEGFMRFNIIGADAKNHNAGGLVCVIAVSE